MIKRTAPLLALVVIGTVGLVRCSEPVHQCGVDINCGDPGGLLGKTAPGPPASGGGDINNPGPMATSTADAGPPFTCTPLVVPEGGTCSVQFDRDILQAKMSAAGTGVWGCAASGCHDPQGGSQPHIDVSNPSATYLALYNNSKKPYVNPCSTDPSTSEILTSLGMGDATNGVNHMPLGNAALPTPADIAMVTTWVACGAPFN